MIPYILHVTAITTVCFLFYKLLLQKETFYRLNRWMLLGCLAVSFTLPLLPVPRDWSWRENWTSMSAEPVTPPVVANPPQRLPDLTAKTSVVETGDAVKPEVAVEPTGPATIVKWKRPVAAKRQPQWAATAPVVRPAAVPAPVQAIAGIPNTPAKKVIAVPSLMDRIVVVLQWLFILYGFGLIVFGGNFLFQIAVLLYQSYSRPVIRDGRFRIVETNGNRAPCSFGNTIFINPANYDWETYNQILIHEKVHISGRHTLDILLAEIAVVLQWFNPFAWLYRREVENNLEFLTDASVLEHREVERSAYQLSLLRVSAPHLPFSITNNYNQSLLKRRIVMMNSKRSSQHTVWKYFFLIPLLTGLVCALNKPAALAADRKNNGPLAGAHQPGRVDKPATSFPMTAAPDTSKKPHAESRAAGHDSLNRERPVLSLDATDGQSDSRSPEEQAAMDEAMRNMNANHDILVDQKVIANEQKAQMVLAQQDMMNRQLVVQQAKVAVDRQVAVSAMAKAKVDMHLDALTNLDMNIGDLRMSSDSETLEGAWFATSFSADDKIQFELKRESENGSWNNTFTVIKTEFNPYPGQGNVEFKLVREAGTLNFKGQFDGQEGFGHFRFTANEAFFNDLKQMGLEVDGRRFGFFTTNVKKEYVAMLQHYFPHISIHEVFACAGNHIDADYIKYWQGAGLEEADNPRTLIQLKSMKVDRAYVDELKSAGYDHLSVRDLVSFKSQRIDGAYLRELKAAGYDHLEAREVIQLKSQHIDGAYIRSVGRGKDNEMIPVRELVSYKSMHIDSGYLAALRKVGYGDLDRNQLFQMYNQHVTADFIKGFQDIGYKDLSGRDLVNLKVMGVTPEFVKGFIDIGYTTPNVNQLRQLKDQHIGPADIKTWRDLGYGEINPNQLISLNNMRITPDFVREFNKIGFDHIPLNQLLTLKSTGVNAEYVTKMKAKGFESKDLGKYVRLKNDFN